MKDPYVNSNGVLLNKLNIEDYDTLYQAEADIGFLKLITVDSVETNLYDEDLIRRIHKHIFGEIFVWAGEYRTVPLVKEEVVLPRYSLPYGDYRHISSELSSKLKDLDSVCWSKMSKEEIAFTFSRRLALIWRVHPFRDGNTRTILSFACIYARD